MLRMLLDCIFGMLPECIFFTLCFIYIKNIQHKKKKLFTLIAISYIICVIFIKYRVIYYVAFIFSMYMILKLLYKEEIEKMDIFIVSIPTIYTTLISAICAMFLDENYTNYYILYFIGRIMLFIPFIWRKHFNKLYLKYKELWNVDKSKQRKIKSITLRNISSITINIFIFLMNIFSLIMLSWR